MHLEATSGAYTTVVQNLGFLSYYTIQQCEWTLKRDKVRRKHINLALKEATQKFPERNGSKYISPTNIRPQCTLHSGLAEPLW